MYVQPNTYILRVKDVADHPVLILPFTGRVGGFWEILLRGLRNAHPCHQNHNAANIGNIRDGTQGAVHHCLLRRAEAMTNITINVGKEIQHND